MQQPLKQIQHHIKYKEIHGYDEIIMMDRSKHTTLHHRLRKEGKCNISVDILKEISMKAAKRTGNDKYYKKSHRELISFEENVLPNIGLMENIEYNNITGNITVASYFVGHHGIKLVSKEIP